MNELIFVLQTCIIAAGSLLALRLGKEALVTFITLLCVLANLFVVKQITLFGLQVTAADAFSVGAIFSLHLLQEFFGKKTSKRAIWTCFTFLLFYAAISQIHLLFIPTMFDTVHPHFAALLQFAPRLVLASLTVYFFVLHLDRFLYEKFQQLFGSKHFFVRNYLLLALIQLIDTVGFSFLGLYGIVNNMWHVVFVSFVVKLAAISLTTPFLLLVKKLQNRR